MYTQNLNGLTISGHVIQPPHRQGDPDDLPPCDFVLTHTTHAYDRMGWEQQHYNVITYGRIGVAFAKRHPTPPAGSLPAMNVKLLVSIGNRIPLLLLKNMNRDLRNSEQRAADAPDTTASDRTGHLRPRERPEGTQTTPRANARPRTTHRL
jgi:hypothetical protein